MTQIQITTQESASNSVIKPMPTFVVTAMCWLFAILFGIWCLPHTVFIRHAAMGLGAILGLYVIGYLWKNGFLKMQINAAPIFLILALFAWVTIHLVWIGKEPELQWFEYARIWKKIFICFPFALGLGLGIRYIIQSGDEQQSKKLWRIIYFGLCLPTIIFFIKFGLTKWSIAEHFELSPYFVLSEDLNFPSGIPKYALVFFSLPALAVGLGVIVHSLLDNTFAMKTNAWHFLMLVVTPIIFYIQHDRNGIVYTAVLILIAIGMLALSVLKRRSVKLLGVLAVLAILLIGVMTASYQANPAWKIFVADIKVALQLDKIDNWKYQGHAGVPYPLNEYGVPVSPSNYERVTWALAGLKLVPENPLGFGLMNLSFDRLTKAKWPGSFMSHTHSAWLDFTLGYGLPGLILLAVALVLAWRNSRNLIKPWTYFGRWGLGLLGLVMCTTEVSSEIYINALIFASVMCVGLTMSFNAASLKSIAMYKIF